MRTDPQPATDERTTLVEFIEFHRATVLQKVAGLSRPQLNQAVVPSGTTMAGLLKHLALVEDSWFWDRVGDRGDLEPWSSAPLDEDPDWDFHSAVHDTPEELVALYEAACARSRSVLADVASLDQLTVQPNAAGERFSVRWVLVHMVEELARHNGHLDILREMIDGSTGE